MHFYGMGFREVLALPIRVFWLMDRKMSQIRAETMLAMMPLFAIPMSGQETMQSVGEQYRTQNGTPMIVETVKASKESYDKLRSLLK